MARVQYLYITLTIPKGPSETAPKGGQFRGLQNLKLRLARMFLLKGFLDVIYL